MTKLTAAEIKTNNNDDGDGKTDDPSVTQKIPVTVTDLTQQPARTISTASSLNYLLKNISQKILLKNISQERLNDPNTLCVIQLTNLHTTSNHHLAKVTNPATKQRPVINP